MSHPVEAVLLGAGSRGYRSLASYAQKHPDELKIVGVAEPDPERRERAAATHDIPPERVFGSWEELLARPQLAHGLINATMDHLHVASTTAALEAGYHVLCEKPMARTPQECVQLVRCAERCDRRLQICHVLRYAPFWQAIKRSLESGRLGALRQVMHTENVAWWHQAHSFVRGNWGSTANSAPMILAKCCHDLDLLVWQLGEAVRLSSYGDLSFFNPANAPEGAGERCLDCPIEPDCTYSAKRYYVHERAGWPTDVISFEQTAAAREAALRDGPYGRCVWQAGNDVVDHQVINIEFGDGVLVAFTMHGFSHENVRTVRYGGSEATLRGHEGKHELALHDYRSGQESPVAIDTVEGGHGGGDTGLMRDFVKTLQDPDRKVLTTARASLESHLIGFAAEESRLTGQPITMGEYRARIEAEVAAGER